VAKKHAQMRHHGRVKHLRLKNLSCERSLFVEWLFYEQQRRPKASC
jgi:hypothetical protein